MARTRFFIAAAVVLLLLGGGASYWAYDQQKQRLMATASAELERAIAAFTQSLNGVFEPAVALAAALDDAGLTRVEGAARAERFLALAAGPVRRYEQINGAFLGFPDGGFLHVQDLIVSGVEGAEGAALTSRIIDPADGDRIGRWLTFDAERDLWTGTDGRAAPYDPRERVWYRRAAALGAPNWSDPYIFATSGQLGVTYARPVFDETGALWGVIGVDVTLPSLSHVLLSTAEAIAEVADVVFATDLADQIVGHPDFVGAASAGEGGAASLLDSYRQADRMESRLAGVMASHGRPHAVSVDGREVLAIRGQLDAARAMPLNIYLARDMASVFAEAHDAVVRNVVSVFVAVVLFGVVATYAVKLRVEAAARRRAEAALIEARDAAEAATRAKSSFLAMMSHEIRTPMNGVMSMVELLGATRLDAEQRRMARVIAGSAEALLTIINDILDFSKIEAGKLEIESVPFSLAEVMEGPAELLAPRAEDKGLALTLDIDPGLVDARLGDPTRLKQILLNLGGNAVKFTESGRVALAVFPLSGTEGGDGADWLRFEVRDTGIGLTSEQRDRLFQPFVQAEGSTARKYGGTGLGLSICQRLADLMGGRIGVDSVAGDGSTFWVEAPIPAEGDAPPAPAQAIGGARVRLVGLDDEATRIAEAYLQAAGVEAVSHAASLAEAAEAPPVDLTLAACTTPDLDEAAVGRIDGAIALVGRRRDLSEAPSGPKARAVAQITLPIMRGPLWRAVAVSLGLQPADEADQDRRDDLAFAPPTVEAARAANALVLVAEDNETNQMVIRQMLGRMGFACEIAENGRVALERLQRPGAGYGLLLTDFNMPEMDGFELARAVRAGEADGAARLPIVALTADALAGTEEACLDAGMDLFLTKPVDSGKLARALAQYLPAGLSLRREATAPADEAAAPEAPPAPSWDPEIFDAALLGDATGALDAEARALIESASEAWGERVAAVSAALAAQDAARARDEAHALKGAALSVGANRLGRIAADIQDSLDAGDAEMAEILADGLEPTLSEFRETLPAILQR